MTFKKLHLAYLRRLGYIQKFAYINEQLISVESQLSLQPFKDEEHEYQENSYRVNVVIAVG